MKKTSVLILALLSVSGCALGEDEEDEGRLTPVSESTCLSGYQWQGGNEESSLMRPGMSCIACHASEGEGPSYAIAGTVYGDYDEPNDCAGVDGVTVEIIGNDGEVFELASNAAGNFWLRSSNAGALVLPYTARVIDSVGGIRPMVAAQTSGDCASCHTSAGSGGAPGRVVAP